MATQTPSAGSLMDLVVFAGLRYAGYSLGITASEPEFAPVRHWPEAGAVPVE